jgi:hypothetical protein
VLAAHEEQTIGQIAYRELPLPGLDHLAPTRDHDDPTADVEPDNPLELG